MGPAPFICSRAEPVARTTDTGTVTRTVALLRELAQAAGDVQIKHLSATLGLAPSTVHRLLDLLAQEGMVERDAATRTYRAGREFFRLAALIAGKQSLRAQAAPLLEAAMHEGNETAYLCEYLPRERKMVFAAACESPHPLGYRIRLDAPLTLVTGASGRAILAWLPDPVVSRIYTMESRDAAVKAAAGSRAELDADLARIRTRGYAVSHGQRIAGAVGVFAPVFDAQNQVVASLGYTLPDQRFQRTQLPRLAAAARTHARALSAALGHACGDTPKEHIA